MNSTILDTGFNDLARKQKPVGAPPPLSETQLRTKGALTLSRAEHMEALKAKLPEDIKPYVDKYFLRTNEILKAEGLNPWVRAQVFIRKGPGEVFGIDETLAVLRKFSNLEKNGGRVYALKEGEQYSPKETLLVIEGRVQDIIELETIYLGVLTRGTTRFNDRVNNVDLEQVRRNMGAVVEAAEGRPVTYFGARHWHFEEDRAIGSAAIDAGAKATSTDSGSTALNAEGIGTIPHALENVYGWLSGRDKAVVESTLAFDRVVAEKVPRIALIDYNNREIDDSIAVARALGKKLYGVRVDTCGENVPQGGLATPDSKEADEWRKQGIKLPTSSDHDAKYWYGKGVTVTGVVALRKALNEAGFLDTKIILTSGFGDANKVRAFTAAEKTLGLKLFDGLGVGGVYSPCRMATMDIVAVGSDENSLETMHKVGRPYVPNPRLTRVL